MYIQIAYRDKLPKVNVYFKIKIIVLIINKYNELM